MLAVQLLVVLFLRAGPNRLGRWVERLVSRLRAPGAIITPERLIPVPAGRRGYVVLLAVLLDGVAAASHQLTPYVLLLMFGSLAITGYLRPWWVVAVMAALTVSYLLPNLSYIAEHFGVFSSFNPWANASAQLQILGQPVAAKVKLATLSRVMVLLVWLAAAVGLFLRIRRGHLGRSLVVAALTVSPLSVLAVQSYGGEARLRVFLYSLPWAAVGIAWLWSGEPIRSNWRRRWTPIVILSVLTAMFVPLFLGTEDVYYIPPKEVAANRWIYKNGIPGADAQRAGLSHPGRGQLRQVRRAKR